MVETLSWNDAIRLLLSHAAADGREEMLFGDSCSRVCNIIPDFIKGEVFPSVYLEFPLCGRPFLDASVGYNRRTGNIPVDSEAASGTGEMLDWFAKLPEKYTDIDCGYELDVSAKEIRPAGVHFQPRKHLELVEPFCKILGEEDRGKQYLSTAKTMPTGWDLSFFGMFRGRPDFPFRICGYMDRKEQEKCAAEPERIKRVFQNVGFKAYDENMTDQIASLLKVAGEGVDFQFDIFPDGSFSEVFAIDIMIKNRTPKLMKEAFHAGEFSALNKLLSDWNIIDERFEAALEMTYTRKLPVFKEDGEVFVCNLLLIPKWLKVRWTNIVLQPVKLYTFAYAEIKKLR